MAKEDYIVSLDIGTSKIRAIIGEPTGSSINVIGVGSASGEGLRHGSIVDIDLTVESIREAIDHAERMVGIHISSAYVGISGNHIQLHSSHGVVAVSSADREISDEDIERVLQQARVVALPPEREVIDVVAKEFVVDGLRGIMDPRGMLGVRLEVEAYLITGSRTAIHNVVRCVERAGLEVANLVLMPLAASHIALSNDERKLGVALVDIGAGATTVTIFSNGVLMGTSIIPMGGDYVTHDIAIGLRTSTTSAEQVKLRHACAVVAQASENETFQVPRMGSNKDTEYTQYDLATIVEPRMQEIFALVQKEVEKMGYADDLPAGYVLHGGVMSTPGAAELASEELQAPVRIAIPEFLGVRDPSFVNGVGTIAYAARTGLRPTPMDQSAPVRQVKSSGGMFTRIKDWLRDFV
ncbi:cell division protein FtsA [Alicyclobacillus acidoterrestris]|uniref:Cell division protein FtsA n=1 Tax=Alicyclobacillus acidoterrestris (strain ATCC 49025 / DSM 3922 / CIP 106132 / NCIMB 13137 / GD3B) TaxID=1356854 RepID=T0CG95_ALIAG|nr:cell division protein FtsA [Alicyclobacillus acidoterrestris]EPZ51515.1 cell division protein FtsA [Alicyclobacillus acidoterrestris ATCC 49025]UNO50585.1 cell division protein FtsA [Alicyclobacillus acidoterrestris]